MNITLSSQLELPRCPHCNVDTPNLSSIHVTETRDCDGAGIRTWRFYSCRRCGGVVTAWAHSNNGFVCNIFPLSRSVEESLPDRAKSYLQQAIDSKSSPSGAIMLCASSVDAMLKEKGYREGNLYSRIDKAAADHLITQEMAKWAHEVRLEANEERHADFEEPMPIDQDAEKAIDFVSALGHIMFTLPERIQKGIEEAERKTPEEVRSP